MKIAAAALSAVLLTGLAGAAEIPAFDVTLTLSPAAAKKLADTKETVTIAAMAMGMKTAPGRDEDPEVSLGQQTVETAGAGTAAIPAMPLPDAELATIDGEAMLLINVYSSRKASEDNILDCEIWQDAISKLPATGIPIACKLIGEE